MANVLATIILLVISFFVINLFPMGRDFFAGIHNTFVEKKTNVVEEYERVKGEVDEVKETVDNTKEKVEETVDTANRAIQVMADILETINNLFDSDEDEDIADDEAEEVIESETKDPNEFGEDGTSSEEDETNAEARSDSVTQ